LNVAGFPGRGLGRKRVSGRACGKAVPGPANATTLLIGRGLERTTDFALSPATLPVTRPIGGKITATKRAARSACARLGKDLGLTAIITAF
jgi:hypothetical protein